LSTGGIIYLLDALPGWRPLREAELPDQDEYDGVDLGTGTIGATEYRVILGGHATSVPFTEVLIGTQRTATDNADASSTCTVLFSRRSQPCPI
jgi:hypothetical protein